MKSEEVIKLLSEEVGINESRISLNNPPTPGSKEVHLDNSPTGIAIRCVPTRSGDVRFRDDFNNILSEWADWYSSNG